MEDMQEAKKEKIMNADILKELFHNLYGEENREKVAQLIANFKSELEELSGVDAFVTARVKNPISIIKKFQTKDAYSKKWNKMKDLIGLMVVVDSNNDVDDVIHYLKRKYEKYKNPNSEEFFKDYRKKNIRDDHNKETEGVETYDPLSDKGYQTCDGYKNVRVNLMIDGYPIEIQIKTKEQYVAHEATHDPVYKTPTETNEEVRQEISDKLFPYFETYAHMMFHLDEMSEREKENWKLDMQEIIGRNEDFYNEHRDIFEDASKVFAFYLFMTNNMKQIYKEAVFGNTTLDLKLLEIEIKRIFHYLEKQISTEDTSLTSGEVFNATIHKIATLDYDEFLKIREDLAGSYRCEKCIVSGVWDLLRAKDVELFKRLAESFRSVEVAVYNDDLAEIFSGEKPMFNLEERQAALRNIKGISAIYTLEENGKKTTTERIEFLSLDPLEEKFIEANMIPGELEELKSKKTEKELEERQIPIKEKTFAIGYLPGVFDMLHPGHVEYISKVCRLCKKVYVGSKSDEYVRIIKKKDPVLDLQERKKILEAIRGIAGVGVTEFDITPPKEVLDEMMQSVAEGNECAIFMGSDWVDKVDSKSERSLSEYENLTSNYPYFRLVSIPRGKSGRSSTKYKTAGESKLHDINPYEFTLFD